MRLTTAFLMTALALAASSRLALADDDDGPPTASWTAVELNGKPVEGLTLDYTTEKRRGAAAAIASMARSASKTMRSRSAR